MTTSDSQLQPAEDSLVCILSRIPLPSFLCPHSSVPIPLSPIPLSSFLCPHSSVPIPLYSSHLQPAKVSWSTPASVVALPGGAATDGYQLPPNDQKEGTLPLGHTATFGLVPMGR